MMKANNALVGKADKGGSIDSRCFACSGPSGCQNGTKLEPI